MAHRDSYSTAAGQSEIKRTQFHWWAHTALPTYYTSCSLALMCADSTAVTANRQTRSPLISDNW